MLKMNVENIELSKLKPYENNARTHSKKQIEALSRSIEEFGFTLPVLIDNSDGIIAGHARFEAAIQIGMSTVPCIRLANFTEAQRAAYVVADNKLAEMSEWNEELLRSELKTLKDEFGFELATLGFSDKEIDALSLDGNFERDALSLDGNFERDATEDELPELPEETITKLGDLWLLGEHRLICGDSTDAGVVGRLLGGAKPHLMVTDPPYGVNYDPKWRNRSGASKSARVGVVLNDDRSDWREAWALFPGDVAYIWHGAVQSLSVADSLLACGFDIRTLIVWVKERFTLSRGDYHWQHETCFYACKDRNIDDVCPEVTPFCVGFDLCAYAVREKKKSRWSGGRKQSTVWNISYSGQDATTQRSTQKPVECMRRPIFNNSMPGDIVYEPFSGSGTTIIAAQSLKRKCYAIELDPRYVDMAVARYEKYTGKKAILDKSEERQYDISKSSL
ncbi:methyltransferase [Synergistales bacterium]|nr:methyltransferase [Synergistales bacterium]